MSTLPSTFSILCAGKWLPRQVEVHDTQELYRLPGPHARQAQVYWQELRARGDQYLFNGELFRLDGFAATHERLSLHLSRTCYRDQIYCNAHAQELLQDFGAQGFADGLGVSALVVTADGYLPIIRRGQHLAEEPGKLDVVGGHAHPDQHFTKGKPDLFRAMIEELETELNVPAAAVGAHVCCGLVQNLHTHKPDLVFEMHTRATLREIESQAAAAAEADEVAAWLAVPATPAATAQFLAQQHAALTPSARACLQLLAGF